jgi:hypothetical protein
LSGSVAAGVRHFGANQGVAPYDGLYLAVNVGAPFVLGTRLLLLANRDVSYAATPAASPAARAEASRNTFVNSVYRGELVFELPWSLHGRAFVGYLQTQYLLPTGTEPNSTSTPRRDHGWIEGGALLRHLGKHLSLGVNGQRETRRSPVDGRTYQGVVYGLAGEFHF